jgi:hypothetical protein
MTEREAREIVNLLEASFTFDLQEMGRNVWISDLTRFDYAIGLEAAVMLCRTTNRRPLLKDVIDYIQKLQRDRAEGWREQPAEKIQPPTWVPGWVVSRYRDGDNRLWPEQQIGYVALGFHWDEKSVMPDEERARYVEEGRKLSVEQLWAMIRSGVAKGVAPQPGLDPERVRGVLSDE